MTQSATSETRKSTSFFTPRRISRMAVLIALSGVGAFVKIPSPGGDLGIDSAPGYFAGFMKKWDWKEAAFIGLAARLIAAGVVGFPFGLPIQIAWGIFLGGSMGVVARLARLRFGYVAGVVAATLWNGPVFALLVLPASVLLVGGTGGMGAAIAVGIASVLGATLASALASTIGAVAARSIQSTNLAK